MITWLECRWLAHGPSMSVWGSTKDSDHLQTGVTRLTFGEVTVAHEGP